MEHIYESNGLVFWNEQEIQLRSFMIDFFSRGIQSILWKENPAWQFIRVEAPLLMPPDLMNPNYTSSDVFWIPNDRNKHLLFPGTDRSDPGLVLRPETTPGSYAYAAHLLSTHSGYKPPLCVWQAGKSFRREQDQVTKNMRLKEFYQQEFQAIYVVDTDNDYHSAVLEPVRKMLDDMIGLPTRVVPSDRVPTYAQITMDVEVDNGEKWMEVCSISRRTDFPDRLRFQGKKGLIEKDALVLEIAIGLDRCLYCYGRRTG